VTSAAPCLDTRTISSPDRPTTITCSVLCPLHHVRLASSVTFAAPRLDMANNIFHRPGYHMRLTPSVTFAAPHLDTTTTSSTAPTNHHHCSIPCTLCRRRLTSSVTLAAPRLDMPTISSIIPTDQHRTQLMLSVTSAASRLNTPTTSSTVPTNHHHPFHSLCSSPHAAHALGNCGPVCLLRTFAAPFVVPSGTISLSPFS
jgi:hypothetical protein